MKKNSYVFIKEFMTHYVGEHVFLNEEEFKVLRPYVRKIKTAQEQYVELKKLASERIINIAHGFKEIEKVDFNKAGKIIEKYSDEKYEVINFYEDFVAVDIESIDDNEYVVTYYDVIKTLINLKRKVEENAE